ncbi:unnamed protein product [Parascedosporium putredinis]|uniref:3-oxo-5-alpha-steroid 4-dehydrogenase C-terminal domain-containing protein n=1 Tax=Parascedosporium putredinis TaxID=1442378 RepID=A0A9P1GWY9_9PEZI|nr:unnamed protein product [Parascedosporium putredinis]CAI7989324.1 unnamed protein product [Parascedosporium putredinis]
MASTLTLKLTNRSPKQPIKKLPATIDVPADATIEDVKAIVARQSGISDHNRIGIFNPATNKTFKDRRAQVGQDADIVKSKELLIKDLGPQIAWRTVFLLEYLGPILFHVGAVVFRPYLYKDVASHPLSDTQRLVFAMFVAHFVKRELETLFVHKFSASTMPARNIFKNCFFYWAFSGALDPVVDLVGAVIFVLGELANASVHLHLSSLRSRGGTERRIPSGLGFSLVTCPNYLFEILSWVGVIIASRDWSVLVFIAIGAAQMAAWAKGKEKAYRKEFGDKYKKKRYVMLPGLI